MKQYYEIKTVADSTLDVDDKSRRVKIVLNKTGVKDFDREVVEGAAFDKTIKERGPRAKNLIWHLTDHNPSLKSAVGKFSELGMVGDELIGVTDIPDTTWGNDVLTFYKSGQINQHSIGFRTIRRETVKEDDPQNRYDIIKEVMLYEGSAVLWGANEFTPTRSVGKSFTSQSLQEKYFALKKEMNSGNYTDEFFQIIDSQLKQLEQLILNTTEPTKNIEDLSKMFDVTQPEQDSNVADALYLLKLKF